MIRTYLIALAIVCAMPVFAAEEAPRWLADAAAKPLPAFGKDVPAVVLLDEESVTMDDTGKIVTESRFAIKVLTREGRGYARQGKTYEIGSSKIREMRGWLITPSGTVRKLGKEDTSEVSVADVEMYSDIKERAMRVGDRAEPGAVFGFESIVDEKSVFTQFEWAFQSRLPVSHSRYSVTIPAGWELRDITFNHDPIKAGVSGNTYTWALDGLPYMETEPASPKLSSLVPRVAVSILPNGGRTPGRGFTRWTDVSQWLSELYDPQSAVTPEIAEKARSLTAGAKNEREKIAAIGRFVQSTRYVAVAINLARGGGMKPHAAAQSLAKAYGDCKDKATLMRALLKAIGITAYPVTLFSGDPDYVRDNWPTPETFNHCIIAIAVADPGEWRSVLQHPSLGSLLIFDPTDPITSIGDLPVSDRDGFALVIAGKDGVLLRLPSPAGSRIELSAEVKLLGNGTITGKLSETSFGSDAVNERAYLQQHDRSQYTKVIERWISSNISAVKLDNIATEDAGTDRFRLNLDFAAPAYGQLMQNRLLVFRPGVVTQRTGVTLTQQKRRYPIVLRPESYSDTFRIEVPEGFAIDELPSSGKLESPYGSFKMSVKAEGNVIVVTRSLEIKRVTAPAEAYAKVREFFSTIAGAQSEPVVLARK